MRRNEKRRKDKNKYRGVSGLGGYVCKYDNDTESRQAR